jgi:hypothetical protein
MTALKCALPGLFIRGSAAELVQTHLSLPQGTFGGDDGGEGSRNSNFRPVQSRAYRPIPYKRMDGAWRALKGEKNSSASVAITHCKLRLAVREKKVSRRKSDCCGWFIVSRFMSRARTARVKASRAMGRLIGLYSPKHSEL